MWIPDHYDVAREKFASSPAISKNDKNAVQSLINKLLATKIKRSRAEKYYSYLRLILERRYMHTFHDVTEEELYRCLSIIEHNPNFGGMAKRDYKIVIKRILEHLNNPLSEIIKTTTARRIIPRFFLTVHDILTICKSGWPHFRDKAMMACLYESNCRPHEFFMMTRDDVRFENVPAKMWNGNGAMIPVMLEMAYLYVSPECKTGARPVPLFFSVPWLKAWMKTSEGICKDNYLWVNMRGGNTGYQVEYETARKAVKQIAKAAGIVRWKEVQLYTTRRGRNTELSQVLSYSQHCKHAGWQQDSDMPAIYNQCAGIDITGALLSPYGIMIDHMKNEKQTWIEILKLGQNISRKIK